jgi:hypothetical protein
MNTQIRTQISISAANPDNALKIPRHVQSSFIILHLRIFRSIMSGDSQFLALNQRAPLLAVETIKVQNE